jgi:diguanylate cyclase (GGDEF)-like protein
MRRVFRPAVLFAGLLAYVLFTWTLLRSGQLHVSESAFQLLIPVWVAGFVLLMFKPFGLQRVEEGHIVLARSIWCNVGAVALAVLVPHTLRLLLLVVPLFSVLYASVHLVGRQVVLVVLATAAVYCLAVLYLLTSNRVDAEFEVLCGLAFALLLGGALLLAAEMQNLRDGLLARNRGLRDAMERLHDMALKDELTGLHNRRSILDVLNRQKALADRGQQAFTLCYCDLDHFKVVNDRYGHAVGDVALRQFAELADAVVRNVDYAARFGGEEFLLVLVDADEDTAYRVSQRLAERTREMWVPGTDPGSVMTVSVGIARYRSGEQVDGVLSRADRALYAAKRAGRDCVQIAEIGT